MLSYRHAFHAGNHADVLKHFVLVQLLEYFNQKDKPYWYIDTHAGAGCYSLDETFARKNAEFEEGVGRLLGRKDVPKELKSYLKLVRDLNPSGKLHLYPGSPCCAEPLLRADDKMRLFELHPADNRILNKTFADAGNKVMVLDQDGFTGINAFLPPQPRRALVLIDPPYEPASLPEWNLHGVVPEAAQHAVAGAAGKAEAPAGHQLAEREPRRAEAFRGWLWHARKRSFHRQPALDAAGHAEEGDALPGERAWHGRRR